MLESRSPERLKFYVAVSLALTAPRGPKTSGLDGQLPTLRDPERMRSSQNYPSVYQNPASGPHLARAG
jgi:hypothetical protein